MAKRKTESEAVWTLLQELTDRIDEIELLNEKYNEMFDEHYYAMHNLSRVLVSSVEELEVETYLLKTEMKKLAQEFKKLLKYLNFMKIINDGIYHN